MNSDIKLISRKQLAQRWGVCIHTVARTKELKPLKFNSRMLRYRLSDVLAYEKKISLKPMTIPAPDEYPDVP